MPMNLRAYLSTYWQRRLSKSTALHIDVFAYEYSDSANDIKPIILEYRLSIGGRKHLRTIYFVVTDMNDKPKQLQPNSLLITDIALMEAVRLNAKGRSPTLAKQWREYHHRYLRDIAAQYPLEGFKLRSMRFWYFVNPDHDPAHGFANWYVAPRQTYARPMPDTPIVAG